MKKLIFALLFCSSLMAQDFQLLHSSDGIDIFYKIKMIDDTGKKNDKYLIDLKFINTTEKDYYYESKLKESKYDNDNFNFGLVSFHNVANIFTNDQIHLRGDKTNLSHKGNPIYILKAKKTYTSSSTFKMEKGNEPNISFTILNHIIFKTDLLNYL